MDRSSIDYEETMCGQDRYPLPLPPNNPLSLPIANVSRIMKEVLDSNTKISKEAKECVQECVGEFIAFITSEASFQCKNQKRKTVNGEDILWALGQVGFDDYKVILQEYLNKYKAVNFIFFGNKF
jgi:nuclear transcription Y subunit beta